MVDQFFYLNWVSCLINYQLIALKCVELQHEECLVYTILQIAFCKGKFIYSTTNHFIKIMMNHTTVKYIVCV